MRYLLVLTLLWPMSAQAGWFSYDNYDDCMLGKMKGQDRSMHPNADKECKKEFKVEFSIFTPEIKWSFYGNDTITTVELEPSAEYVVSSGKFTFSDKPCADAKDSDMGKPIEIRFINNQGSALSGKVMHCARALDFRGRYK